MQAAMKHLPELRKEVKRLTKLVDKYEKDKK
jgi:hypothetical protein